MATKFQKFNQISRILTALGKHPGQNISDARLFKLSKCSSPEAYANLRQEMVYLGWINPPVFGEEQITLKGLRALEAINDNECPFEHGSQDWARWYWKNLSITELKKFQKYYTTGKGKGSFIDVHEGQSIEDYILYTALQSEYETIHDL